MANTLGTLIIELQAATGNFAKGMNDAKKISFDTTAAIADSFKSVAEELGRLRFDNAGQFRKSAEIAGRVVAGIGTAVVGASVIVAKETAEQVKQMTKLSQSYGLSVEAISRLRVASKITGIDMETLSMGLGRMAKAAATAAEGGKMQAAAFQSLGVQVADGAGHLRPMNALLLDVAAGFSKMQDSTGKTALAMQLFGRSGAQLIPFFNRGSEGVKQLLDLSDQLGMTWSETDAKNAEIFQQSLEILDLKSTALKENFVKGLLPALDSIATAFVTVDKNGNSVANTFGQSVGSALKIVALTINEMVAGAKELYAVFSTFGKWGYSSGTDDLAEQVNKIEANRIQVANQIQNPVANPMIAGGAGGSGTGNPTFSNLNGPKSNNLAELLNKARETFNKIELTPLDAEISNIEHLRQELEAFRASHPEAIFLDINAAVEKLSKSEDDLIRKMHESLAGEMSAALRNQAGAALSLPTVAPGATGSVLQQRELYDLGNDMNAQNRERLQIFQATESPLEKYQDLVARLNILYSDHSSEEYVRALDDAREKMLGVYDPAQKLEKEMRQVNEEFQAGLLSAGAYTQKMKELQMQLAAVELQTADFTQGIRIGLQQTALQWTSWGQLAAQSITSVSMQMKNLISQGFTEMIMGTKTVGQAFAEMGRGMVQAVVSAVTQMLAEWIVYGVIMKALSTLLPIAQDPQAQAAKQLAANVTIAQSNAGVAASMAFVEYMPEGIWTAIAMSALADGIGQTFVAQASMAEGGYLPRDMVIQAHKGETVVPAKLTSFLMSAADTARTPSAGGGHLAFSNGGSTGGGSGMDRLMGPMTLHVHGASDPMASANAASRVINARMKAASKRMGVKI